MKLAKDDPDLFVRKAAVESLGAVGDPKSTTLLRAISKCENRFLASVAIKSLLVVRRGEGGTSSSEGKSGRWRN